MAAATAADPRAHIPLVFLMPDESENQWLFAVNEWAKATHKAMKAIVRDIRVDSELETLGDVFSWTKAAPPKRVPARLLGIACTVSASLAADDLPLPPPGNYICLYAADTSEEDYHEEDIVILYPNNTSEQVIVDILKNHRAYQSGTDGIYIFESSNGVIFPKGVMVTQWRSAQVCHKTNDNKKNNIPPDVLIK